MLSVPPSLRKKKQQRGITCLDTDTYDSQHTDFFRWQKE